MLSLKTLPLRNLKSYPQKTILILFFIFLMTVSVFGGLVIVRGISSGLRTIQLRLGADILVTPENAKNEFDAQTFLIQAEPGYFYMNAGKLDEILAIEGIEKASPQMFLASASSSCCSAKLQIIAFDPETDFTIQHWIRDTFGGARKIGLFDVIVGSKVTVYDDHIHRLYNNDCNVIGQFAPTGSTLDNAVYTNFDTIRVLIKSSFENNLNKYQPFNTDDVISAVMIKIKPEYEIEDLAERISNEIEGVSVATAKNMVSGIVDSLDKTTKTVTIFVIIFWAVDLMMTVLLFVLMIHERIREFGTLRVIGASKGIISGIVTREALTVSMFGGLIGILFTVTVFIGFSNLIEQKLGTSFIIPPVSEILLSALLSFGSVLLAGVISAFIAIRQVNKIDTGLILKEGE